jgi:hypothetical protein
MSKQTLAAEHKNRKPIVTNALSPYENVLHKQA